MALAPPLRLSICALLLVPLAACSSPPGEAADGDPPGAGGGPPIGLADRFDQPIAGLGAADRGAFFDGDALFGVPLREADGLGPLYTRSSCAACHETGLRGPGSVQKMAVMLADGRTPDPDQQSLLPFGNTVHPLVAGGGVTPILPPDDPRVLVSVRVGPPVLGRGYMEAIDDAEILRVADEQSRRDDAIHGRVNHVVYASEPNPDETFSSHRKGDVLIGRFGVKARIGTLDDFTADALQGDMGITSPLRPAEIVNPDGLLDDQKPGVDVTADSVNARARYIRLTAIPERRGLDPRGQAIFDEARCSACHVPSLRTRADYPIALLAGIDAPVYTDMLLHDMGDDLADGVIDGEAGPRDFRTAPLVGIRFDKTLLHDGRARTVEEAIRLHGGEAADAASRFQALSDQDQKALLAFVKAL